MLSIKRFSSFEEIKPAWQQLEKESDHFPFQAWWYQNVFARHFCDESDLYILGIYTGDTLLAIGTFEKIDTTTIILLGMKGVLGDEYVTDYGDILLSSQIKNVEYTIDDIWGEICNYFSINGIVSIYLDCIREDSQTLTSFQKRENNGRVMITPQEVAPYILPMATWEDYLASLPKRQRHELKRKLKRFELLQALEASCICPDTSSQDDFEHFIRLLRLSNPNKKKFMSEKMKAYLWDIVNAEKTCFETRFCFLHVSGKKVAAILTYNGLQKVLLYNSGFDPSYSYYSVGLMLNAYMIKNIIEKEHKIYDLMQGSERYKYDLGAKNMQLYRIIVHL